MTLFRPFGSTLARLLAATVVLAASVALFSPVRISLRDAGAEGVVDPIEPVETVPGAPIAANADSARVAGLLAALGRTNPLICELAARSLNAPSRRSPRREPLLMLDRTSERRRAVERLVGRLRGDDALAAFRVGLTDDNACVRGLSAGAIGSAKRPGTLEMFLAMMGSRDAPDRETAAIGLGHLEDARGIAALGSALGIAPARVKRAAAWALGEIEDPRAVEPLSRALRDRDPGVREMAAWALGNIEEPRAADALRMALADEDAGVREAVADALARLGWPPRSTSVGPLVEPPSDA